MKNNNIFKSERNYAESIKLAKVQIKRENTMKMNKEQRWKKDNK